MLNLRTVPFPVVLGKRKIMKLLSLLCGVLMLSLGSRAQMKQGRIVYERKVQLKVQVSDPAFQNLIPNEHKDQYELLFDNTKTLWRIANDGQDEEMSFDNGSGAQISIVTPGSNDVLYSDLTASRKVEQNEVMTKEFTVEDNIMGYTCKLATTSKTQKSKRVNMNNGEMKTEEVTDTLNIVAWFTDAITLGAGPESYQGQLPGTILELDINNGRCKYTAVEISPKMDPKEIKEPKGKKITQEQFEKERDKLFKEMNENDGGNYNIRRGG